MVGRIFAATTMTDERHDGDDTASQSARAGAARKGSPFLNTAQAAHYLGLSERTLRIMRGRGDGPPFRKHGRLFRYHIAELDAWSLAHRQDRKAAETAAR